MADEKPEYKVCGMEQKWEEWVRDTTNYLNATGIPIRHPVRKKGQPPAMNISERLPYLKSMVEDLRTDVKRENTRYNDERNAHRKSNARVRKLENFLCDHLAEIEKLFDKKPKAQKKALETFLHDHLAEIEKLFDMTKAEGLVEVKSNG